MSKEPEPKDIGERRRRRGGLRVPSDNVPRRVSSESDVSAPVPEAVGLAASVSESFGVAGDEKVGELRRADSEHEEMATIVSEPIGGSTRLETEDDPEPQADTLGVAVMRAPTDEPFEDEPFEDEPFEDEPFEDEPFEEMPLFEEELVTGEVDKLRHPEQFEDEEATRAELVGEAVDEQDPVTGESVDIPFDDGDEAIDVEDEATPSEAEGPSDQDYDAEATVEAPAHYDRVAADLTESPVAIVAGAAAPAAGKGKKARFKRAMTMALSESDLEEVGTGDVEIPSAAPIGILEPLDSGDVLHDDEIEEISVPDAVAPGPPVAAEQILAGDAAAESAPPKAADPPAPPPTPIVAKASKPAPTKPAPPKAKPAVSAAAQAAAEEKRRRRSKPWFEEIFDEDYLRTLPFLTPQATQFEANFVMESLGIDAGAQILDVGCGYGRHAMELAARGYHVVGLDSSLPLLLRGADEAQRRGLTINFVHGDMREMTFESQFDGAYCLFSSFGYFDDETNKRTAQNIAKALKPGARFVVEVLNRDYLVADLPSRVWWEGDGCVVLEEVEFNYFSSRIVSNRSVVFDDGRQLEHEISLRSFSLHELGKFLHAVGFRVLEISGSMSTRGRFFGAHSRDIVVVAERRGSASDESQS